MNHNMLVDYLPETVEIEGTEYAIETNFRTFILFEMMMQDPELSDAKLSPEKCLYDTVQQKY